MSSYREDPEETDQLYAELRLAPTKFPEMRSDLIREITGANASVYASLDALLVEPKIEELDLTGAAPIGNDEKGQVAATPMALPKGVSQADFDAMSEALADLTLSAAKLAEAAEIEKNFEEPDAEEQLPAPAAPVATGVSDEKRALISSALADHKAAKVAAPSSQRRLDNAEIERRAYAAGKALEGKTVRAYHRHDIPPPPHPESGVDRRRREGTHRQRIRRGKTDETVRSYTDRSTMTPDELKLHEKKLRDASRAAKKALTPSSPA